MRIRALDRKLLRDCWHLRGPLVAVAAVVACGVAVVITTRTAYTSLLASRAAYYESHRFADLFAHLKRAPDRVAEQLGAIPGVARVEPRVLTEVTVDVPGLLEPAVGRLISLPDGGHPGLNDVYLRSGRWPTAGRAHEVIVSEPFATANQLRVGDSLGAVINGRWQRLWITGIGLSPEYVYEIGEGQLFPDSRRFGIIWMNRSALAAAFDLQGAFNDVSLRLAPGASEAEVTREVNLILAPYGGLDAYGRQEQPSARFLNDEIAQNRVSGTLIPGIFLGIAGFLINVVLSRLVGTERQQIGTLKAFGYSDRTIGGHYFKLALATVALGGAIGVMLGLWTAAGLTARYAQYYRFPTFVFRLDWSALGLGLGLTLFAAVAGAAGAVGRVVRLPPAVAMQPVPPSRFRAGLLERIGLSRILGPSGRMVIRNIARRPLRTLISALGVACAVAILMVGRFFVDALRYMGDVQFRRIQRETLALGFRAVGPAEVGSELAALPGVLRVETFRVVPVRLRAGPRSRRVSLLGFEPDAELHHLIGQQGDEVPLPAGGLVLTTQLSRLLGVGIGDTLTVEVLEGARQAARLPVQGLVDELLGLAAYMDIAGVGQLLREQGGRSGAWLRADPGNTAKLFDRLKQLPGVASVSSREAALASFEATLARSIGLTTAILVAFAGALAVAMVYNSARIALAERARELASLRVLGFTRDETAIMLLGEQGAIIGPGIVLGLGMGYASAAALSRVYQWEMFRIPIVVSATTCVFAAGTILVAAVLSFLLVLRRLARLDLITVLKARE